MRSAFGNVAVLLTIVRRLFRGTTHNLKMASIAEETLCRAKAFSDVEDNIALEMRCSRISNFASIDKVLNTVKLIEGGDLDIGWIVKGEDPMLGLRRGHE